MKHVLQVNAEGRVIGAHLLRGKNCSVVTKDQIEVVEVDSSAIDEHDIKKIVNQKRWDHGSKSFSTF